MSTQSELFPEPPDRAAASTKGAGNAANGAAPLWLQRLSLTVLVLFCIYLGALVAWLPWWSRVWDENPFFFAHPELNRWLHVGWVRGLISGLGLLDVWIGISEVVSYREHRFRKQRENL